MKNTSFPVVNVSPSFPGFSVGSMSLPSQYGPFCVPEVLTGVGNYSAALGPGLGRRTPNAYMPVDTDIQNKNSSLGPLSEEFVDSLQPAGTVSKLNLWPMGAMAQEFDAYNSVFQPLVEVVEGREPAGAWPTPGDAAATSLGAILGCMRNDNRVIASGLLLGAGAGAGYWLVSTYFSSSTGIETAATAADEAVDYLKRKRSSDGVSLWDKFQEVESSNPSLLRSTVEKLLSESSFKELSEIQAKNHLAAATLKGGEGLDRMLAKRGHPSAGEAHAGYFDQMTLADEDADDIQNSLVGWVVNLVRAAQANPCESFHDYANTESTLAAREMAIISGLQNIDSGEDGEDIWQKIWDISHDESQSDSQKTSAVEHLLGKADVGPDFYERLANLRSSVPASTAESPAIASLSRQRRTIAGAGAQPPASSSSDAAAILVRLALQARRHYTTAELAQADPIYRSFQKAIEELERIQSEAGPYDLADTTVIPDEESDFGKLVANYSARFREILQSQPERDEQFRRNLKNEGTPGYVNLDPDHLLITAEEQYKARQLGGNKYYPARTLKYFKPAWILAENSVADHELKRMASELGGELRYDGSVSVYALLNLHYKLPIAQTTSAREVADAVRLLESMRDQRLQRLLAASHQVGHGSSDYPIMRHQLAKLLRQASSGPVSIKGLWVRPGEDSPFHDFSRDVADPLTELRRDLESSEPPKRVRDSSLASRLRKLDLTKPFELQTKYHENSGRLQHIRIDGVGKNGVPSGRNIPKEAIQTWSSHAFSRLEAAGKSEAAWMPVNADGAVPVSELLRYYGVMENSTDWSSLSKEALTQAIATLYQERQSIQLVADRISNPEVPEHFTFVMTPGVTDRWTKKFQENGADDYEIIARRIRGGLRELRMQLTHPLKSQKHFGASESEIQGAMLTALRQAGGITLKLRLLDTDGMDSLYELQHSANPERSLSLISYCEDAAEVLGEDMVSKIKEQEGDGINIEELELELIVPHLEPRRYDLTEQEIEIFNIRSSQPPFLYLDPLEQGGYEAIQQKMGDVTQELAVNNGTAAKCKTLYSAAEEYLRLHQGQLEGRTQNNKAVTWQDALIAVTKVYYRASAKNVEELQRRLVRVQPKQVEFLARKLCLYLDIKERYWIRLASTPIRVSWEEGALGLVSRRDISKTLLEILYDEHLRKRIGDFAHDKKRVVRQVADAVKSGMEGIKVTDLYNKIESLFQAWIYPGVEYLSNYALPSELVDPIPAYTNATEQFAKQVAPHFRSLEAERMLLIADDSVSRMARYNEKQGAEVLLTEKEIHRLDERERAFTIFLIDRANRDDFRGLSTTMGQVLQNLRQDAQTIPVLGNAINLFCDAWQDHESQAAQDALLLIADLIGVGKFESVGIRALGTLLAAGVGAWTLKGQIKDWENSVRDNDTEEAARAFFNIFMGLHQTLQSGGGIVNDLEEAAQRWSEGEKPVEVLHGEERPDISDENASGGIVVSQGEPEIGDPDIRDLQSSRYWLFDSDSGQISERAGRKVVSSAWNGDAMVEKGARAIRLGDTTEATYMLNDVPHWKIMGSEGPELRPIAELDLPADQWTQAPGSHVNKFSRFPQSSEFPSDFAGRPERTQSMANTVSWYDNCHSILEPVSLVNGYAGELEHIGVVDHKYVAAKEGGLTVLEHVDVRDGKTMFVRPDGSSFEINAELPVTPEYNSEIDVKIVGAEGMFVAVEITNTVKGLQSKRVVSGVVAPAKSGGQELVLRADHGVHYRATLPSGQELALVPGETASEQKPLELKAKMISPHADPKRASPSLWRDDHAYKEQMAHDDFALELYYGAKAANEAGSKSPEQVEDYVNAIKKLKGSFTPGLRETFNPYYVLSTSEEHAILFAPRNQARLAGTLLEETVTWGEISDPEDVGFVRKILKRISVSDAAGEHRSVLLDSDAEFPSGGGAREIFHEATREKLRKNLLLAEVQTKNNEPVYFVDSQGEPNIEVNNIEVSNIEVSNGEENIRICSGGLMDSIEAEFPDPKSVKGIRVFSLDDIPEGDVRRIFRSSQRGYKYLSVTSIEAPRGERVADIDTHFDIPNYQYGESVRSIKFTNVDVDLTQARYIDSGPQAGSYLLDGVYYVKLDNGLIYRAKWDWQLSSFTLVPSGGGELPSSATYPVVRHIGEGEFVLRNRPGLKGGIKVWQEPKSIPREKIIKVEVNGKEVFVGKEPLSSKDYAENRYAVYMDAGAGELRFEGTYLEKVNNGYKVAPESDVQEIWNSKYWDVRVAASEVSRAGSTVKSKGASRAKAGSEKGRTLVDVVTLAPELLERLDSARKAKIPQRLKIYRSMPDDEAEAILTWAKERGPKEGEVRKLASEKRGAKEIAKVKENLVIGIGKHLGGLEQALGYKGKTLEFVLKPGAVDVLLDPKNGYVAMQDKGLPKKVAAATKKGKGADYPIANPSEGTKPGYIGIKAESPKGGTETFSVALEGDPARLLFQLFIEDVHVYSPPQKAANEVVVPVKVLTEDLASTKISEGSPHRQKRMLPDLLGFFWRKIHNLVSP